MNRYYTNFNKYKDLLIELIKKDIQLKYKNSYLGVLWSFINPLLMMVILTIVFSELFKNNIANFPVYVLTGRMIYSFFSESTNFAMNSIVNNNQLIRKVYVPKYFFPLSKVCSSFITSLISLIPVFLVMLFTGMEFSVYNLFLFVPLFLLLIICMGIGLLLSTIFVFFRDMGHLYSVILLILMYMTPIFYPEEIIPKRFQWLIEINPMYPVLQMLRDLLINNQMFSLYEFLISIFYALVYFSLGLLVFYKKQDRFIYHL
ncbi:ABC transporter permease [Paenibacillus sp. J45TS6]|uniref:ABC transporter permease n=1 Tax=Paenibacillus sp. J45TS6 TaxID=2807196 RepID=UPI001BCCDDA4|nr:ABC transporter permease [Paenibacillus sp. J45TS6]